MCYRRVITLKRYEKMNNTPIAPQKKGFLEDKIRGFTSRARESIRSPVTRFFTEPLAYLAAYANAAYGHNASYVGIEGQEPNWGNPVVLAQTALPYVMELMSDSLRSRDAASGQPKKGAQILEYATTALQAVIVAGNALAALYYTPLTGGITSANLDSTIMQAYGVPPNPLVPAGIAAANFYALSERMGKK